MTKSQEIEILLEAAAKLGLNSYCGPWLAGIAEEVRAEIRSDFMPSPSLAAANREAEKIKADAKEYSDGLIAGAEKFAANIRTKAVQEANGILNAAIEKLVAAKR